MTVDLGARYAFKPPNVAALRPLEVIDLMRRAFRESAEFAEIRDRVDFGNGRPRQLQTDVLLAACVATAATNQSNMHVRGVSALLRALPVPDQRVLGVRWTDPNGRGDQLITERQVTYLFGQIAAAFDLTDALHDHPFVMDGDVWSPDGEFIKPLTDLGDDERELFNCSASCPLAVSMQDLGNRMLNVLWKFTGVPDSDSWAIDSSVVETHFAPQSWGKTADIAKDWVPDEERGNVASFQGVTERTLRPKGTSPTTKATNDQVAAALATYEQMPAPERDPRSRKPVPVGPVVRGEFTRVSSQFPQLGPDGRLAHTKDAGARNAFRGAGASRRSGITNGRDQHSFVASGKLPDGSPFPPFTRAYNAVPGGYDKGDSCLGVLRIAEASGVTPSVFTADRIYTALPPEVFERVAVDEGWTLIRDLKEVQRKLRQWVAGVNYHDGWWFTTGMPAGLNNLPRPGIGASRAVRQECQDRFDQRRPFMFRRSARLADGGFRLRGPALPDRVDRDPVTGQVTAVHGVRVRCINSPHHHLLPRTLPQTSCQAGKPCGCSKTLTVHASEIPNSCEPLLWGSTIWATEYARRNMSEAAFSLDEYHYGRTKDSIRVRAHKWDFAFAMLTLANFIRMFHSFVMRLGAHALDPGHHSALEPDVFTPALERVLTQALETRRSKAPPGS